MKNKKVIFFLWREKGKINASFKFAKELTNNGFDVTYINITRFKEHVEENGFKFKNIYHESEQRDNVHARKLLNASKKLNCLSKLCESGLLSFYYRFKRLLYLEDIRVTEIKFYWSQLDEIIREIKPDVVLIDNAAAQLTIPFLNNKIPLITLNAEFCTPFNAKFPPVYSSIYAEDNPSFKLKIKYTSLWIKVLSSFIIIHVKEKLAVLILNFIHKIRIRKNRDNYPYETLRKQLKRYNQKLLLAIPFSRVKLPELILSFKEFDFPYIAKQRGFNSYIGGCVDLDRVSEDFNTEIFSDGKKIAYLSMGKILRKDKVENAYNCVIEAFKELKDWILIVHVNSKDLYTERKNAENIFIFDEVPQILILQKATIYITHGGFSSIRESIYCGTPMVVLPTWSDSYGNAARIEYLKLGIRRDIKTVTKDVILDAVEEIMTNETYSNSVRKMQDFILKNNNCDNGIQFVNAILDS